MDIRKIILEEMDSFEWTKDIKPMQLDSGVNYKIWVRDITYDYKTILRVINKLVLMGFTLNQRFEQDLRILKEYEKHLEDGYTLENDEGLFMNQLAFLRLNRSDITAYRSENDYEITGYWVQRHDEKNVRQIYYDKEGDSIDYEQILIMYDEH